MKLIEKIAYLLVLASVALWMIYPLVAAWLMVIGALGVLATHLNERYGGKDLRQRRNMRLRYILGLFYGVTAWMMFPSGTGRLSMDWLPFLCIAVALELYTLWVISRRGEE